MNFGVLRESAQGERRVALVPSVAQKLIAGGHRVHIESGAGYEAGFPDTLYTDAGCSVDERSNVMSAADVLLQVSLPGTDVIASCKPGTSLITMVYPKRNAAFVRQCASSGLTVFAMDAMPRTTRAQTMDVLSSQNNLAGYKAVIVGAGHLGKIFPLMMTAAGTVTPAKVLIYGAGVAGLQALATAKRLGARVEVTDVRFDTKEQVESLGGTFIMVEGLDTVNVQGGYVAAIPPEILERQQQAVERSLLQADVVILTALVQGGHAPRLVSAEQVSRMKPGSVIVDMAADAGGNCELTTSAHGSTTTGTGVHLVFAGNLASSVPQHASELYAKNILAFLNHVVSDSINVDVGDDIVAATLVCHQGEVRL